jgi:hypothetical protein
MQMPYFVYKLMPPNGLDHIETKDRYQDAKNLVRTLRESASEEEKLNIRLIFANTNAEAEKLLLAPREERVVGED